MEADRVTAELNQHEITEEHLYRIQTLRDLRAEESVTLYEEDPWYWLLHIDEKKAKKLLADIWYAAQQKDEPMDYKYAEMSACIENNMKHVAELRAIEEIDV